MQKEIGDHSPSVDALTLRAILESAAAGIITINAQGRIETANPSALRLFGYCAEELIGQDISILMPEPDRSAHARYVADYLRTGQTRIIGIGREVKGRHRDGSIFPMHLSVGEFLDQGEKFFTGVIIDLSAQKKAESSFARQQALFQAVFESLPDPIVILDAQRRVQLVNPAFLHVFGEDARQLVGQSSARFYESTAEWEHHGHLGFGVEGQGEHKTHVLKFRRMNDEIFPGAAVRAVIRDRDGAELGFLKVIRDISDELRREEALMQSQRMEAIGQLTGGIAHDFNNLLTVILGNLELLEPALPAGLPSALAREAQEAAEMGARLTDRLLTFGRRQHLETKRIDLNEFVLGLIELLRRSIGEDIDLSTSLAGELWLSEVDPGQVENAVLNLAINARDAMPQGGRLVIETRNTSLDAEDVAMIPGLSPGDYVVLSVSDTGSGMSPEVKARAFEPFFTTKGAGKGSGLGLATIYGFAKQSGGHVTIYSEVGQGTIVNLYLPRASMPVASAEPESRAQPLPEGRGERILVVEDDERVRRLTTTRLTTLGYAVLEARNGAEALELLDTSATIDLVFTDLVMPGGMSGLDLVSEVRTRSPDAKVLLTSGYAEEFVKAEQHDQQQLKLLRKPYRQADLAAALRDVLGRSSSG